MDFHNTNKTLIAISGAGISQKDIYLLSCHLRESADYI